MSFCLKVTNVLHFHMRLKSLTKVCLAGGVAKKHLLITDLKLHNVTISAQYFNIHQNAKYFKTMFVEPNN